MAFSPDGHTLVTGSTDGPVRLWNVTDPTHPAPLGPPLPGPLGAATAVAFSPDGRMLATAGYSARLWDVASHQITTLTSPTGVSIRSVAFSPDGRMLATTSNDEAVQLWDIDDPHHPSELTGHPSHVYQAAFSPDGQRLATVGDDDTVRLWDLNPDRVMTQLCHIIEPIHPEQWKKFLPDLPLQFPCPEN